MLLSQHLTSRMCVAGQVRALKKGMLVLYMRVGAAAPQALQLPGSSRTSSGAVYLRQVAGEQGLAAWNQPQTCISH